LIEGRHEGQTLLSGVVDLGNQLFTNTSSEGREAVRQQLRDLRLNWEQYVDQTVNTNQQLEHKLANWTNLNKQYDEMNCWLHDILIKVSECQPNDTFHEKKDALQYFKV